jgi:hypothetical protein
MLSKGGFGKVGNGILRGRRLNLWSLVAAAGLLILVGSLAAVNRRRSALDELWGPVLKAPGEVLVCVGVRAACVLQSAQAQDEIQGVHPAAARRRFATPAHSRGRIDPVARPVCRLG